MTATLAYQPPVDAPDPWDLLDAVRRHARPEVSERQRFWTATKGGPRLAALLADVDVDTLTATETISFARAVQRQRSWTDSLLLRASERLVHHRPGPEPHQESLAPGSEKRVVLGGEGCPGIGSFAVAEWAVALRITRSAAHHLIGDALDFAHRLQGVAMAARIGHTDTARARMVASATRDLTAELTADLEELLIPHLGRLTRRRLERMIDRLLAEKAPELRRTRAEKVRNRREVFIDHTDDDHAEISGTLDAVAARLLDERLDAIARQLGWVQSQLGEAAGFGPAGETRDQRRARALGLLAEPGRIAALSQLTGEGTESPKAPTPEQADAAAARPVTLYVHLRPDGTLDLEGHGCLTRGTVADLLAGAHVTVRPVIDPELANRLHGLPAQPTAARADPAHHGHLPLPPLRRAGPAVRLRAHRRSAAGFHRHRQRRARLPPSPPHQDPRRLGRATTVPRHLCLAVTDRGHLRRARRRHA